jgi:exodeoxyribonuclease VII large subunit
MDFLTLFQFNSLLGSQIKQIFSDSYWIQAETSDVRLNKNGICYLELIEKKEETGNIIARASAHVWANNFPVLKAFFEEKTGQTFVSGIKVLVRVTVDFHPLYGYSLSIFDIDPTYTLGDIQRRRQEILRQLEQEGILTMNQELELPFLAQRIAVVTSPTAAGYEDFLDHLMNNEQSLVFYPHLFPTVMQGEQTEASVIEALEKIFQHSDSFDVVVIIRGGGASSDLMAFDSYSLAVHCAQFPLPIITGIGHERDNTVLDYVANYRAKTPTAVADYLVSRLKKNYEDLLDIQTSIIRGVNRKMEQASMALQGLSQYFPIYINTLFEKQNYLLTSYENTLIKNSTQFLQNKENQLKEKESFFKLSSPEFILSRGYSITTKNGKVVKNAETLEDEDVIHTRLAQGEITSIVKK